MNTPIGLNAIGEAACALAGVAAKAARKAKKELHNYRKGDSTRNRTLRPGPDTPLWNELVADIKPRLTKRGDKAVLGRYLKLPRQRVDDFLNSRRALPDAERTLMLLHWLHSRKQGTPVT